MSDADTSTELAIGVRDGKVVLNFHRPTQGVTIDPMNALHIGEALARAGHEARNGGHTAVIGTNVLRQEVVNRLYIRIDHVLRSMADQPRERLAREVVDIVLAEVT